MLQIVSFAYLINSAAKYWICYYA